MKEGERVREGMRKGLSEGVKYGVLTVGEGDIDAGLSPVSGFKKCVCMETTLIQLVCTQWVFHAVTKACVRHIYLSCSKPGERIYSVQEKGSM